MILDMIEKLALKISGHRYNFVYDLSIFTLMILMIAVGYLGAMGIIITVHAFLVFIGF